MKIGISYKIYLTIFFLSLTLGCTKQYKPPNLGELYTRSAKEFHKYGNPVIVIPGILGSTLKEKDTGQIVWGAFDRNYANPETPEGARLIALPLDMQNTDNVVPDGALERVKISLFASVINIFKSKGFISESACTQSV